MSHRQSAQGVDRELVDRAILSRERSHLVKLPSDRQLEAPQGLEMIVRTKRPAHW